MENLKKNLSMPSATTQDATTAQPEIGAGTETFVSMTISETGTGVVAETGKTSTDTATSTEAEETDQTAGIMSVEIETSQETEIETFQETENISEDQGKIEATAHGDNVGMNIPEVTAETDIRQIRVEMITTQDDQDGTTTTTDAHTTTEKRAQNMEAGGDPAIEDPQTDTGIGGTDQARREEETAAEVQVVKSYVRTVEE